jgi:site-specific DNA-methyltransferase (adenine-specific)
LSILIGDCREVMTTMEPASVDAVVCDPPYGLEFMGKEWDRLSGDPNVGKARAKGFDELTGRPDQREGNKGGTWFGSRESTAPNYYRTTNAKCRKCGKWRISGGHDGKGNTLGCKCADPDFPNIKASAARAMQEWHFTWVLEALRVLKPGGHLLAFGGSRTFHRLTVAIEDAGFEIRDCLSWLYAQGFPKSMNIGDGRGTALKPAWEPIIMARKPLIGTVAANMTAYGTGGLNIDACRIATDGEKLVRPAVARTDNAVYGLGLGAGVQDEPLGRWPANVILDETAAELLDEQSGERTSGKPAGTRNATIGFSTGITPGAVALSGYGDTGGASRFFYCAKASRAERNAGLDGMPEVERQTQGRDVVRVIDRRDGKGPVPVNAQIRPAANHHPTVKPVALMRWLVRLVTPPDGLVLDPFAGSGSTGVACAHEGFRFIGIEREEEYAEIARRRIAAAALPLFTEMAAD